MNNQEAQTKIQEADFNPPKLPFSWMVITFISPILIVAVPYLLTSGDVSFTTLIIIALSILSVLLFIACIIITLDAYKQAYKRQAMQLYIEVKTDLLQSQQADLERMLNISSKDNELLRERAEGLEKSVDQAHQRIDKMETINSSLNEKNKKIENIIDSFSKE